LKQACRKEDFAVRVGGEEFILVLPHCHYENAVNKAEVIRQELLELKPEGIVITASFGVAGLDPQDKSQNFSHVFQMADRAVYYSKENGRNQVTCAHSLEIDNN
ncbi:MAG: GGDEF domain-containing protein, partial [Kangiellaceae bacterium]|nr:GGDEF domain-containing protein [Kangiellaceae bacterium]